ncbi:MAG: hypothetical protein K6C08_01545 [Oscillospiraceae bacterium]|nr:hypothetical protein [Oscillospiraceae bacterium]
MSILILCAGSPPAVKGEKLNSSAFDALIGSDRLTDIVPYTGKRIDTAERDVYIGEGIHARQTAEQMLGECPLTVEPMLNEVPLRSFTDTEKEYPAETWLRKAATQRRREDPRQAEGQTAVNSRADLLEERFRDVGDLIVVTYPVFLETMLERFRIRDWVIARSEIGRFKPLERLILSRKDEHCGGCGHNCFLSNPGCGIGRDKAMRRKARG